MLDLSIKPSQWLYAQCGWVKSSTVPTGERPFTQHLLWAFEECLCDWTTILGWPPAGGQNPSSVPWCSTWQACNPISYLCTSPTSETTPPHPTTPPGADGTEGDWKLKLETRCQSLFTIFKAIFLRASSLHLQVEEAVEYYSPTTPTRVSITLGEIENLFKYHNSEILTSIK